MNRPTEKELQAAHEALRQKTTPDRRAAIRAALAGMGLNPDDFDSLKRDEDTSDDSNQDTD